MEPEVGELLDEPLVRLARSCERDLDPFCYPKMADLHRVGIRSVCLGSFIPWDVKKHAAIIKEELGWRPQYESWRRGFVEDLAAATLGGVAN